MNELDVLNIRISLGLNQEDFAKLIGVSKNTVWNYENGAKIPDSKIPILRKILKDGVIKNKSLIKIDDDSNKNLKDIPEPSGYYYPDVSASAGLETEMQNEELNKIPINIPNWGNDLSFINVYGDSMYPKYCAGEIIGIKEIEANMLHFGLAYVIIMQNGEVYLKYITAGKNDEYFTLSSENPKNPPREYHLSLIRKIYIVKGVLTKTTM